jgi:hypothetical protein
MAQGATLLEKDLSLAGIADGRSLREGVIRGADGSEDEGRGEEGTKVVRHKSEGFRGGESG